MAAAEVRGTGQKKECFRVSKEGDRELLSQEGTTLASRGSSEVLGSKAE